jgi:hypothetical protein
MKLRVFPLPIQPGHARLTGPEPEVPGWSWFRPFLNSERLVQVTDEGVVGLVGINQFRNQDRDLFLEMKVRIPPGKGDDRRSRAQVVHASEDDVWVLARGGLRLWHFDRFGPNLLPLWPRPLTLGSPLHASQVDEGRALVVVTQSPTQPVCLATSLSAAADRDAGEVRWQKQLGLLCRGEAATVGGKVLLLDQGGGLYELDPKDHAANQQQWEPAGRRVAAPLTAAAPLAAAHGPYLLPHENGATADVLALSPTGRLVLRSYEPGKAVRNRSYAALGLPTAAPARLGSGLVLALENGLLVHLPSGAGKGDTGPEWRARHADRDVPGYVAALGGDEFLSSDGSRGLTRWRWAGGRDFEKKTSSEELPARIVSTPLVLPRGKDKSVRVCIADSRGILTLLHDTEAGGMGNSWKTTQTWDLAGRITAGPFPCGEHVGCIVNRRRLVCIHPDRKAIAWTFEDETANIVGLPRRLGTKVVVGLQSGRFRALNPATGKAHSPGYRLEANVAPVAGAVPFGKGRLLAPLSDGTLMILTMQQLR